MSVVDLNIPAQDFPDLGKRPRPIGQLNEGFIAARKVEVVDPGMGIKAALPPVLGIDSIYGCRKHRNLLFRERVFDNEIALLLELQTLRFQSI